MAIRVARCARSGRARNRPDFPLKEFSMKRLIRLVLIGTIGMVGILFIGRNSLLACLHKLGFADESALESMRSSDDYDPVFLTEWLASDILRVNLLPAWMQKEGVTAETVRAYAELHELRQDSEVLVDEQNRANKHQEAKDQIINRLVAREIHLLDAAKLWVAEDRAFGHRKTEIIRQVYPGNTETESYCQRIVRELEQSARLEPRRFQDALTRARAELRVLKVQGSYLSSN
jgi:hypothetical protein